MRFFGVILIILSMFVGGQVLAAEPVSADVRTEQVCRCSDGEHTQTIRGDRCVLAEPDEVVKEQIGPERPLFSFANLFNLMVLIFLQAVLGFDNLLYISLESQRAPKESQKMVRKYGILIAIALRVVLLFVMIQLIESLKTPFFHLNWDGVVVGHFTFSSLVFIAGGVFIMYTAVKEIAHMLKVENLEEGLENIEKKSVKSVIAMIVVMNLVFSFDSILSALAITDVFIVLALAIVASGLAMLFLADQVSNFLQRNRKYEVLGMFVLLIVGIVLLGEGGHVAHLKLLDNAVVPMSKSTFYFSIAVLVLVDVIQSGYEKKLNSEVTH